MGEVQFVIFDAEKGKPTGSVSGSPIDVADFLAIWMKNTNGDVTRPAVGRGVDPR